MRDDDDGDEEEEEEEEEEDDDDEDEEDEGSDSDSDSENSDDTEEDKALTKSPPTSSRPTANELAPRPFTQSDLVAHARRTKDPGDSPPSPPPPFPLIRPLALNLPLTHPHNLLHTPSQSPHTHSLNLPLTHRLNLPLTYPLNQPLNFRLDTICLRGRGAMGGPG